MPLFRPNFNFKNDGLPAERDPFRHLSRIVKPGTAVCREPGMKEGGTTVVMLPVPDFQDPDYKTKQAVLPDRYSSDPADFSSWVFKADGIRRFGKNPISLLFDDPEPSTGFDRYRDNPAYAIYNTMYDVVKSGLKIETPFGSSVSDNWVAVLKGESLPGQKPRYADISRPGELYLTFAAVWSHGKENYAAMGAPYGAAPDDLPVVFVQSLNTFQSFLAEIDKRGPNNELLVPNITGAKFVHFYDRKGSCPAQQNAMMAQASTQMDNFGSRQRAATGGFQQNQASDLAGYGVYLSDTASGRPQPLDNPLNRRVFVNLAVNKVRPWDQVLRGFTPDETAAEIANHAGLPASILYHCWKHKPEWYSEEMRTRLKNPVSVNYAQPQTGAADFYTQPAGASAFTQPAAASAFTQPAAETYPLGSLPWDNPPATGRGQFAAPPNFDPQTAQGQPGTQPAPTPTQAPEPPQGQPTADPRVLAVDQAALHENQRIFRERMAARQQPAGAVERSQAGR